jgi:hypothetical protein
MFNKIIFLPLFLLGLFVLTFYFGYRYGLKESCKKEVTQIEKTVSPLPSP